MLYDAFKRPLKDLRISVTDRCNFRCFYCMPLDEYNWIDRAEVLTFEEIERLARIFVGHGVEKIRLTGGEPLVRRNLDQLVARLSGIEGLKDLSLTTNGARLAEQASGLRRAGLGRITVSLDTLRPERFREMTKRGDLNPVLEGIFAARDTGFDRIKINAVVIRGTNDDEIPALAEFGRANGFEMRFIEYMDVGNANGWALERTVTEREIFEAIHSIFPLRQVGRREGRAPAVDYEYCDGLGTVGIIGSVTQPFCSTCTRARLTADGRLVTCLFAAEGRDLKALLRAGASDGRISDAIAGVWQARTDRYSEERLLGADGRSAGAGSQKKIEMITLGG